MRIVTLKPAEGLAIEGGRQHAEGGAVSKEPAKCFVVGSIDDPEWVTDGPVQSPYGYYWPESHPRYSYDDTRGKLDEYLDYRTKQRVIAREADAQLVEEMSTVNAKIAALQAELKALKKERSETMIAAVPRLKVARVSKSAGAR